MYRKPAARFLMSMLVWLSTGSLSHAASYTYTMINVPGMSGALATGINNVGQITGYVAGTEKIMGFLDNQGTFTTIDLSGSAFLEPLGINDAGQIVGTFGPTRAISITRAFLYEQGAFTTINAPISFPENQGTVFATDINNRGQIVGYFNQQGFLDDHSAYTVINVPGAFQTQPTGINDVGQMIGVYLANRSITPISFLYDQGVFTDIVVPGAVYGAQATGINNSGQIVGYFSDGVRPRGFLDDHGAFTTFDIAGSYATQLWGINDVGQIIGTSRDFIGVFHSFLATPTTVPEPASFVLLAAGLAGLGALRWRKQNNTAK